MGIDRSLHVWPARLAAPKAGALLDATRRLVEEGLVAPPCLLIVGQIEASPRFWMNDTAFIENEWKKVPLHVDGVDPKLHRLVYSGYSIEDLVAAVEATAPDPDACVVFAGLDLRHKKLGAAFEKRDFFSGTVRVVELHAAKDFETFDAYAEDDSGSGSHTARRLFIVDGKSGPDSIKGTPLKPLLEELFGKNPKEACTQC